MLATTATDEPMATQLMKLAESDNSDLDEAPRASGRSSRGSRRGAVHDTQPMDPPFAEDDELSPSPPKVAVSSSRKRRVPTPAMNRGTKHGSASPTRRQPGAALTPDSDLSGEDLEAGKRSESPAIERASTPPLSASRASRIRNKAINAVQMQPSPPASRIGKDGATTTKTTANGNATPLDQEHANELDLSSASTPEEREQLRRIAASSFYSRDPEPVPAPALLARPLSRSGSRSGSEGLGSSRIIRKRPRMSDGVEADVADGSRSEGGRSESPAPAPISNDDQEPVPKKRFARKPKKLGLRTKLLSKDRSTESGGEQSFSDSGSPVAAGSQPAHESDEDSGADSSTPRRSGRARDTRYRIILRLPVAFVDDPFEPEPQAEETAFEPEGPAFEVPEQWDEPPERKRGLKPAERFALRRAKLAEQLADFTSPYYSELPSELVEAMSASTGAFDSVTADIVAFHKDLKDLQMDAIGVEMGMLEELDGGSGRGLPEFAERQDDAEEKFAGRTKYNEAWFVLEQDRIARGFEAKEKAARDIHKLGMRDARTGITKSVVTGQLWMKVASRAEEEIEGYYDAVRDGWKGDRALLELLMPEGVPEVLEDEEEAVEPAQAIEASPVKVVDIETLLRDLDATQEETPALKATLSAAPSRHASPDRAVAPAKPLLSPARIAAPTVSQPTTPNRKSPQPATPGRGALPFANWTPLSPSPSARRRKFAIPPLLKWDDGNQMGLLRGLPDGAGGDEESAMRGLLGLIADDEEMEWEEPHEVQMEDDGDGAFEDDESEGEGALLMMARTISERPHEPVPRPIWPSAPKLAAAPAMQPGPAPTHPGYWPGPAYMGGYHGSSPSPPRPPMMMQPPGFYYPPPGFGYGSPPGFRPSGVTPMVRPAVEGWN